MLNRVLNHLEELLVTCLMGAATLIIFVSVVHRYLSGFAHSRACRTGCSASISAGRRNCASSCSSGWPSSARPTACVPASMSAWMC